VSDGADFIVSQLMRGVGQILGMLFLSQAVVRSVPREDAGDASGLFNSVRNLGGSLGLAGISILQDQRMWVHSRRMEESLGANDPAVQAYVGGLAQTVGDQTAGLRLLAQQIQAQALTMTYNDIFWIMGMGTFCVLPLVLFLRPLPQGGEPAAVH
jgi:MFS transporter, DHA2 family, multidrug resistance protein